MIVIVYQLKLARG